MLLLSFLQLGGHRLREHEMILRLQHLAKLLQQDKSSSFAVYFVDPNCFLQVLLLTFPHTSPSAIVNVGTFVLCAALFDYLVDHLLYILGKVEVLIAVADGLAEQAVLKVLLFKHSVLAAHDSFLISAFLLSQLHLFEHFSLLGLVVVIQ